MQRVGNVGQLVGAQVAADTAVHLHLLVPLVQLPLDDVTVDGVNQQVLELAHVLQLQLLQQQRVRQALQRRADNPSTLIFLIVSIQLYGLIGNGKKDVGSKIAYLSKCQCHRRTTVGTF